MLSGSGSELERDLPFSVFVDALDEYVEGLEPHRLEALEPDVRSELAQRLPVARSLRGATGSRCRTSVTGFTARCVSCSNGSPRRSRSCSSSTIFTGRTRDRSSCSVRCCAEPPDAAVLMAIGVRPRQMPERLSASLERAHRLSGACPLGTWRSDARRSGRASRLCGQRRGSRTRSTRRAAAIPSISNSSSGRSIGDPKARQRVPELSLSDPDVPPAVATALAEEFAFLSVGTRVVLRGAAVAGDPFEPELAAAAAATTEARDARCRRRTAAARSRSRNRRPPPLPLSAPPRPARGLRVDARRVAAGRPRTKRRSARRPVARCPKNAPTTSSALRVAVTAAALAIVREAGDAVAHRAPASAARWFAAAPTTPP